MEGKECVVQRFFRVYNDAVEIYAQLLLNYLPRDRSQWEEVLKKKREMYQAWVRDLIIDPHDKVLLQSFSVSLPIGASLSFSVADVASSRARELTGSLTTMCASPLACTVLLREHFRSAEDAQPLSTEPSSTWNAYFKDQEMLFEIDKVLSPSVFLCLSISPCFFFLSLLSVCACCRQCMTGDRMYGGRCRTCTSSTIPSMTYLRTPSSPLLSLSFSLSRLFSVARVSSQSGTKHAEALKRILFIYAKLNPGIKYVQGLLPPPPPTDKVQRRKRRIAFLTDWTRHERDRGADLLCLLERLGPHVQRCGWDRGCGGGGGD